MIRSHAGINRRDFLKIPATAGVGLVVSIYLQGCDVPPTVSAPTAVPTILKNPVGEALCQRVWEGEWLVTQPSMKLQWLM